MSGREHDSSPGDRDGGEPAVQRRAAAGTPAERRYGSPLAQALAGKGVTAPTAGDAAQVAVDGKGGGAPVDSGVRAAVEPHLAADLGGVRVHSDPLSQQATSAMGARAFAHGSDVFLGPGESAGDVGLMAHELTHVVQQGAAGEKGAQRALAVGAANSPAEHEADKVAGSVTGGGTPAQLIVDDGAPVGDGQMNRNAFMAALKPQIMKAAEEELGFIRSIVGCPYIEKYFNLYSQRDARTIESAARKFAPGTRTAKSATEMIGPIVGQVREGVKAWVKDGSLIGPAAELDPGAASAAAAARAADSGNPVGSAAQTKPADGPKPSPVDLHADAGRSVAATEGALSGPAVEARSPAAIRDSLGPGEPLDGGVASRMGDAMGQSFSDVRVHTDATAAHLARQEQATAFTVGNQIAFGAGQYQPGTPHGDALLAHELAHVAQQRGAPADTAQAKSAAGGAVSHAHEEDADRAAVGVMGRLWGGVKSVGENVGPALTSGFGLRRCGGGGSAPDPVVEVKPGAAKVPPQQHVTFTGDMFRMTFGSSGEKDKRTFDTKVDYTGPHESETSASDPKSLTLSQPIKQKDLTVDAMVKSVLPNAVNIDIFKNDYDIVKVSDKPSFDEAKKARKHDMRSQMFGVTGGQGSFWIKDPKAGPLPGQTGPAFQEDIPGEASRVFAYKGNPNKWQIRVDLDGDQYKETLVEIDLTERWPTGSGKTFQFTFTQLSSGAKVVAPPMTMKQTESPFEFPFMGTGIAHSDGATSTNIQFTAGGKDGKPMIRGPLLMIQPPAITGDAVSSGAQQSYSLSQPDGYAQSITLPKDPEFPKKVNSATDLVQTSTFWSSQLQIGPYNDKFRMVIEPQGNGQGRLGVAPLERADPKAIMTTTVKMPGEMKPKVLATGGVQVPIDLDGDGKADIEIFSRIAQLILLASEPPAPEQAREVYLRLRGSAMAAETAMGFYWREGEWSAISDAVATGDKAQNAKVGDLDAAAAVHGGNSLEAQAKLPTYDEQLDAWDTMMQLERKKAFDAGILTKETYDALIELTLAWAALRPQIRLNQADTSKAVQPAARDRTAAAAEKLNNALKAQTGGMKLVQSVDDNEGGGTIKHYEDKYTGESKMESESGGGTDYESGKVTPPTITPIYATVGYGPTVAAHLRAGKWQAALGSHHAQIGGVDKWVVDQTAKKLGDKDPATKRAQYLAGMRSEVGKLEGKKGLTPVPATFHPSADYKPWEGGVTQVPLALFYWEDGNEWKLRDLHNPAEVLGDVDVDKGADEKVPPKRLFQLLDHRKRFPKGVIHYQIPNGPGDKVPTTEKKKWHDYLAEIAMVVAVIGLAISAVATAGTTLAIAGGVLMTASAVGGAVAAGADIADHAEHGVLDGTTLAIDVLQIASAVFAVGAVGFGRVVMRGAAAEAEGASAAAKAAAPPAWLANAAKGAYVPMRVGGLAADGMQLLICTDQALDQMKKINEAPGTDEDRARAKRQIIMALAIQGGFFALSIKGELPTLGKGMNIGVTMVGKKPIAHVEAHLDPNKIKFSQENVGALTRDGITLEQLKASMKSEGWKGEPIHVVELPDGSHLSLDNRRLLAARQAVAEGGLKGPDGKPTSEIPTKIHHHNEPMPQDWATKGFVAEKNIYKDADGNLTTVKPSDDAVPVIPEGHVAQTYGEAATIRTANQDKIKTEGPTKGQAFPIGGTLEPPRVRGKKPGGGSEGGGTGGNDVDASTSSTVHVDPNNDAARLQTKGIETALAEGKTKYDFAQKSKDGTTTFGAEYKKWIEGPEPVDVSGKQPKANYKGHEDFRPLINDLVAGEGNIALNVKAHINEKAVADLHLGSLNPENPNYWKDRQKLIDKFGEEAVLRYENARLGGASDPSRQKVFEQVGKIVGPDAITELRNAFPDCEIYITGSSSQPGKGKPENLAKIEDLDIVLIVPDGTDGVARAAYEAKAKLMSVPTTPEFAAATKRSRLPIDASARTKENAFGFMTAEPGARPDGRKFTPLEFARVDANAPTTFSVEQRGVMSRVMTSSKFEDLTPSDLAEVRHMIAEGQINPKDLPPHVQSNLPSKAAITTEEKLHDELALDKGYVDQVAKFKKVKPDDVIDFYQKGREQGIDHQKLIEAARRKYPELSQQDAELIYGYTTKLFYRDLNRALSSGTATKEAKELSAELVKAIQKMPAAAETQYRGLRLDGAAELEAWDKKFALGNQVESDAFWSTGPSSADAYGAPRSLIIKTKSAKDISDLAFGVHMHDKVGKPVYSSEAIIPPGVKFKVIHVDAATGRVTLQEI